MSDPLAGMTPEQRDSLLRGLLDRLQVLQVQGAIASFESCLNPPDGGEPLPIDAATLSATTSILKLHGAHLGSTAVDDPLGDLKGDLQGAGLEMDPAVMQEQMKTLLQNLTMQ